MISTHIKTSLSYIRRSPFQALAAMSILALTFFVSTLVAVLLYSSNQVLIEFETRPQILAFLKKDTTEEQAAALKDKLSKDERVRDVIIVSKSEALEIYKSLTIDEPLIGELVSPSTLPSSVEFSAKELAFAQELIDLVRSDPIVDSVGFTASVGGGENSMKDVLDRLRNITYSLRVGGAAAVSVLSLTSFLVLMVVISMRIQTRRGEIETLSLIGATKGFIRTPIVFEALQYAIVGAIIGWTFGLIAVLYATPSVLAYFGTVPVLPREAPQFFALFGILLGIEVLIAMIIALAGSIVAVARAFKS